MGKFWVLVDNVRLQVNGTQLMAGVPMVEDYEVAR